MLEDGTDECAPYSLFLLLRARDRDPSFIWLSLYDISHHCRSRTCSIHGTTHTCICVSFLNFVFGFFRWSGLLPMTPVADLPTSRPHPPPHSSASDTHCPLSTFVIFYLFRPGSAGVVSRYLSHSLRFASCFLLRVSSLILLVFLFHGKMEGAKQWGCLRGGCRKAYMKSKRRETFIRCDGARAVACLRDTLAHWCSIVSCH